MALRYADQIFTLGRELLTVVRSQPSVRPLTLLVGVAETMPKLIAYRMLRPALQLPAPVRAVCREDGPERLLAELAVQDLDVVLADVPAGPGVKVRVFHHPLGECGVSFFAAPRLAAAYRRRFPRVLDGAPFLLPRDGSPLRAALERWFADSGVRPRIAFVTSYLPGRGTTTFTVKLPREEEARSFRLVVSSFRYASGMQSP